MMNGSKPFYSRGDNGTIDLLLDHAEYGIIPFTAAPGDGFYERAMLGEFGAIAAYTGTSAAQQAIDAENATAKAALAKIDADSVRSIREWIAAQPSAPQILKNKDAAAVIERGKLK